MIHAPEGHSQVRFRSPEGIVVCRDGDDLCPRRVVMEKPTPTPSPTPTVDPQCPDVVKTAHIEARNAPLSYLSFELGDGAPGYAPLVGELQFRCSAGRLAEVVRLSVKGVGRAGKGSFYTITPEIFWASASPVGQVWIGLSPTPPGASQNYISVRSPAVKVEESAGFMVFTVVFDAGHSNHGWGRGELVVRTEEIVDCVCVEKSVGLPVLG